MAIEVEMKFKIDSITDIEYQLVEKEAKLQKIVQQKDHYFNHPLRDFAKTDEAFRIRESANNIILTYKGPKIDRESKTRKEYNLELSDLNIAQEILLSLGFKPVAIVSKERKIYLWKDITICLDFIETLGSFLEAELVVPSEKEYPEAKTKIKKHLEQLGIEIQKTIRKSYLELLLNNK
ncbi:class IV adenylate cyclase [Candidatus Heimdallarchaeota archaeon]|nr:MAG: class IV adenylate cyclase [Candidatus Heimdallarchaeota archaeon]